MDEDQPFTLRHSILRLFGIILGLLLAILLVYVLSVGPALYWTERHATDENKIRFNQVYRPLWHFIGKAPPLRRPFTAYLNYWYKLATGDELREQIPKLPPKTAPTPP